MAKVIDTLSHAYSIAFLLQLNIVRMICYNFSLLHVDFDWLSFGGLPSWVIDEQLCYCESFHWYGNYDLLIIDNYKF